MHSAIQIHNEVINKQRKIFPSNFWKNDNIRQESSNCVVLTRYLIEERLKWNLEDVPKKINRKTFNEYRLGSLMNVCFGGSPILPILNAYPGIFKEWEFNQTPNKFWSSPEGKERAKAAIKWMIEEKMKIPFHEIPSKVDGHVFMNYGLKTMLNICFNSSPYQAIAYTYPGSFTEFDFPSLPSGYWQGEQGKARAAILTRDLFENRLKIPIDQIPRIVNNKTFYQNGFGGMFSKALKNSTRYAITNAYPNRFKAWDFKIKPNYFWDGPEGEENIRKAIKWLVEEKMQWNYETAKHKLTRKHLKMHGLQGIVIKRFSGNPSKALEFAYNSP